MVTFKMDLGMDPAGTVLFKFWYLTTFGRGADFLVFTALPLLASFHSSPHLSAEFLDTLEFVTLMQVTWLSRAESIVNYL